MTANTTADDSLMSEITVVQFETSPHGGVHVSELGEGPPFTVHGVALGAGDVTVGQSGIKKKWPAEELEKAADSLQGTNLVVDHDNDATGVVGRVTKAGYKKETGVVYEAELYDEKLAEKVQNGLLEVSIRGFHADVDSLEEDEETDAKIVEDIQFDNLSIVPTGAAPSNTLEMGEHAELSAAELSAFTDTLEAEELQEIEPGMWVKSDGTKGVTISQVQDGEIEVDVYEEVDGKWRAIGETKMMDVNSLEEWDVDEDDIGSAKEKDSNSEEENAAVEEGDFVQWKGANDEPMFGQVVGIHQDSQQFKASIRLFTESGDELDTTKRKPLQGLDKWDDAPIPGEDDGGVSDEEMPDDDSSVEDVSVNDLVKVLSAFVEQNAVTTTDTPTEDAEPTHEPMDGDGVESLLERFIEEKGSDATIAEFREWLDMEDLSDDEPEGAEEVYNSEQELQNAHEGEPHRYIDAEDEQLSMDDVPPNHMFKEREEAQEMADELGLDGIHEMDGMWIPGETHEEYMDNIATTGTHDSEDEESEDVEAGDDESEESEESEDEEEPESDEESEESDEDEEEMASREDMEDTLEIVNNFLDNEGAEDKTISEFLDWADEDPPVRTVVDTFTNTVEDGSKESEVRALVEWLNGELTSDEDENEEEASTDEGEEASDVEEPSVQSQSELDGESRAKDSAELQEYEFHEVSWDGTTESDWSTPNLEDFPQMDGSSDWSDLSESDKESIGMHFLISSSGFPAEEYGDMKLPVVEPNGDLNVNALAAVKGGRGTSAVEGLSDEMGEKIDEYVNNLANEHFDRNWGKDEEENEEAQSHDDGATAGRPTPGENTVGGVRVLSGDDLRQLADKSEESDADSLTTYKITMTENIEEKLSELDEPVAVEAEEVEELRNKADRFEEMSENLEALRERTDILDDVDRSQVEELAESEDAVVVESARYEELTSEAEQVAGVYAAQLAEEYPAFTADELTDKFSIEELREKYEEQIGDVEDLASSDNAEPRSQDADEESLEEASEESDDSAEEELADEAAAKQDELKSKILGGN